jgi:hypothetical protein
VPQAECGLRLSPGRLSLRAQAQLKSESLRSLPPVTAGLRLTRNVTRSPTEQPEPQARAESLSSARSELAGPLADSAGVARAGTRDYDSESQ